MQTHKIQRVQGVIDALAPDCRANQAITARLQKTFESFAYQPIDVPILEQTDLYLRKSGEEIIDRLYDFVYRNRRLCLRPEMTASVMRAFIDHFPAVPLPVRLHYAGPVFRYEKLDTARYRQFTQIGVELIGAPGAMADAEVIRLACDGLEALGFQNYRVVIGHIGVLNRFIDNLKLDDRLRSLVLSNLPRLNQANGKAEVLSHLAALYPEFSLESDGSTDTAGDPETHPLEDDLVGLFRNLDPQTAKTALLGLLERLNIGLTGNREPDEIVERLLIKLQRQDQSSQIRNALDFVRELSQIKGEPAQVLIAGRDLLDRYQMDHNPLLDLAEIAEVLQAYGVESHRICLDLGLSRGLEYYTGMVFEIHHQGQTEGETQLCGGGRYDDLIGILGGTPDTPATGFAYGLERLRYTLEQQGLSLTAARPIVQVFPQTPGNGKPPRTQDRDYAIQVSDAFRKAGVSTALGVQGPTLPLSHAPLSETPSDATFLEATPADAILQVQVNADQQADGLVVLIDQRASTAQTLSIAAAIAAIQHAHIQPSL